ncbi:hypothetical protein C5167_030377 [Papaver somniferum]|nr:hypothetical protein C5167_030377 [Papaver somniferum]
MSESSWEKKLLVYKRLGWSDAEIRVSFMKLPNCMRYSEKKITLIADFLVKEMGYNRSDIASSPRVLGSSLNDTIIPRCSVLRMLVSKGLIEKLIKPTTFATMSERRFLDKFVFKYEKKATELFKVYQGLSGIEVANFVTCNPYIFKASLNLIIPFYDALKSILHTDEIVIATLKRCVMGYAQGHVMNLNLNIDLLRKEGVPESDIFKSVTRQPRGFLMSNVRFEKLVENARRLGFEPRFNSSNFIEGLQVIFMGKEIARLQEIGLV